MVLRSYDPGEPQWVETDEPCQNCGEPVWMSRIIGFHPDGVADFGTAYRCPACKHPHPSKKPLEDAIRRFEEPDSSS